MAETKIIEFGYKVGDIVPEHFRNCGGSYGLEYTYPTASDRGE